MITQDEAFKEKPADLVNAFQALEVIVQRELTEIEQRRQEEGEAAGVEYDQVFNDFATDEFVNKNIRVRPVSGMNDDTKDGR